MTALADTAPARSCEPLRASDSNGPPNGRASRTSRSRWRILRPTLLLGRRSRSVTLLFQLAGLIQRTALRSGVAMHATIAVGSPSSGRRAAARRARRRRSGRWKVRRVQRQILHCRDPVLSRKNRSSRDQWRIVNPVPCIASGSSSSLILRRRSRSSRAQWIRATECAIECDRVEGPVAMDCGGMRHCRRSRDAAR